MPTAFGDPRDDHVGAGADRRAPRHGKQILPHAVGGAGDYRRRNSIEAMKLAAWESDYVFQVQARDGSMSKKSDVSFNEP